MSSEMRENGLCQNRYFILGLRLGLPILITIKTLNSTNLLEHTWISNILVGVFRARLLLDIELDVGI